MMFRMLLHAVNHRHELHSLINGALLMLKSELSSSNALMKSAVFICAAGANVTSGPSVNQLKPPTRAPLRCRRVHNQAGER